MGRKSRAEVEARRNDVHEMLLEGKSKSFIISNCLSNWGVKLSAVEHDIAAVRGEIKKSFQKEKEDIIGLHIERYENLYRFYMDKGTDEDPNIHFNPEVASKMLEKKEKLLQLHNPDVVVNNYQQNNLNLNLENYTYEELQKLLSETQ